MSNCRAAVSVGGVRLSVRGVLTVVVALLAIALAASLVRDDSSPNGRSTTVAPANGKPIVTRSSDSLAPENAPAHWLPPEAWVYNHWLPFDERRLYSLLGITRVELWRAAARRPPHAGAARARARLAGARARSPRHSSRRSAARVGAAQRRDSRSARCASITQGHLAQHVFFHSLHQFAIPSAAPEIFGVTDARFRAMRRAERRPLAIAPAQRTVGRRASRRGRSPCCASA